VSTEAGTQGMLTAVRHSNETTYSQPLPAVAFGILQEGIQHFVTQWNACTNVGSNFVWVSSIYIM
jgi:hypothetical protein